MSEDGYIVKLPHTLKKTNYICMAGNQLMKKSTELEVIIRCEQNQAKFYNEIDSMVWSTRGRRTHLPR